jgi:hypothetical protein
VARAALDIKHALAGHQIGGIKIARQSSVMVAER